MTSWMRRWLTREKAPFVFTGSPLPPPSLEKEGPVGLYVHIPFCRSLCGFCPYCKEVYDKQKAARYLAALLREIDLAGALLPERAEATSLYFGGGTPALMADELGEIIRRLEKYFIIREGIGVELHPDDVTEPVLAKLRAAGVTMISVGVQSFDEDCLSALGRARWDSARMREAIAGAGFSTVDMDLIFAVPGGTADSLKKDVETCAACGATQISTYPFIDFSFANNKKKPLPEREKRRLLAALSDFCRESGWQRTSVWTFARPGTEKYSSITRDSFLGFGMSASTLLADRFTVNTFSLEGYIDRVGRGMFPTALSLRFTPRQRMVYYLFWHAYALEFDERAFREFFGVTLGRMYGAELWAARLAGLLRREEGRYRLTDRGAYLYHYVEQAYTAAYIDKTWALLRREAFPDGLTLL